MSLFLLYCIFSSQNIAWWSTASQKYVCSPHLSFSKQHSSDCTIHCSSILKEVLPLEDNISMCVCTVYFSVWNSFFSCALCERGDFLRINAKGQQFVGVQVVEGAEVWKAQEQLGEEGGIIWTTASDQWTQGADKALLELLHGPRVRNAGTVWGTQRIPVWVIWNS